MNVTEYNARKTELGITASGINSKTKIEVKWKDGSITPAGTPIHIDFSEKTPSRIYVIDGDKVYKTRLVNAQKYYTGINKAPSLRTLEKYSSDGIAKTAVGEKIEPDGFGPSGAPSWMLVMGII
jgi:3D (Asp-Asp-Asp) domain-containing protein